MGTAFLLLEEASPRLVLGAPSGGKGGNDLVLGLARGLLRTLMNRRKKDSLAFGEYGTGASSPFCKAAACSNSVELKSSDVWLFCVRACVRAYLCPGAIGWSLAIFEGYSCSFL